MAEHRVGDVRPTQLLHTYGVGAMVDLPNIAAMVMGLDDWKLQYATPVGEERLLAAVRGQLGPQVERLMLPPVDLDESSRDPLNGPRIGVPVAAFPQWYRCPWCDLVAPLSSGLFELQSDPYRPDRVRYRHVSCNRSPNPPAVLPTRFQLACKHGHVDDFPWLQYVHSGSTNCNGPLRLRKMGVGDEAANLFVHCDSCGQTRSLVEAFGETAKADPLFACRGRRPHLRDFEPGGCTEHAETMLLGASNSWFGISLSALSIPRHADPLPQLVEDKWVMLQLVTSAEVLVAFRAAGNMRGLEEYDDAKVWEAIQVRRSDSAKQEESSNLKEPEWQVFSTADPTRNTVDFELTPVAPPVGFEAFFEKVVRVERLREVRALVGFTRIDSPGDYADPSDIPTDMRAPLSRNAPTWVPVSEVRGEGLFLQFKRDVLLAWAAKNTERESEFIAAHAGWKMARNMPNPTDGFPGLRFALIHSFSHALMRQLALQSGYSAASIRERIYCDDGTGLPMAGLLLYTAAPDSEGTLGGLVSQGEPARLGALVRQALDSMQLCTSDPLCGEHRPANDGTASLHGAACHACQFAPETSCERGNKYLDRSLLVQTLGNSAVPLFL
ncbi:DUF1998 domain-containing protein [Ralstonia pickettii]|uniref:DUF1998 domain-containing protein n=1 Tax=Ralstonia pickettii TaxID=329 RepID=UPI0015FD8C9C|nr:DUF1998 domain-containing protein [Ralstonia pickettii]MBB0026124.1 DUF1998 domain-containing protein [Ralstonia pickettii]MBB0036819.1 DUF1998 domain-containing protein [Ralstonia pickettii]MBB0099359.1 DUF1998 domain-containing protein [Ralstonia pickettii]MBB0109154.1 DUF1998 domain-containing protein [Ralstonia pickettii]MBB0130133.1 DUF1998 domain-containing protein [Ralstonia pickettii]